MKKFLALVGPCLVAALFAMPASAQIDAGEEIEDEERPDALAETGAAEAEPGQEEPYTGSEVRIEETEKGYQLYFNAQPYFIKGAGYRTHMDELVAAGGNAIRTWSASHLERLLNEAHARGVTVCIGLWLGHERHGFDYSDEKVVARQLDKCRFYVNKYRNHPALLMWGVGNEAEWITGTNVMVYKAINDIAGMIKQVDPHHPTMTVLGEIGTNAVKLSYLEQLCPNVDVLGINSFGGLRTLPDRLRRAGWEKPYVVTEFGPLGPWEVGKTSWGAELEQTSTAKGKFYFASYARGVKDQPQCLGAYVFLWGFKHEVTPTWFSMFLSDGAKLSPVEYMAYAWSGKWPANRAPLVSPIQSPASSRKVQRDVEFYAFAEASDPDGDPVQYQWEVMSERKRKNRDGTTTTIMKPVFKAIVSSEGNRCVLKTPKEQGMYRLFLCVRDGKGGAATANIPFFVP